MLPPKAMQIDVPGLDCCVRHCAGPAPCWPPHSEEPGQPQRADPEEVEALVSWLHPSSTVGWGGREVPLSPPACSMWMSWPCSQEQESWLYPSLTAALGEWGSVPHMGTNSGAGPGGEGTEEPALRTQKQRSCPCPLAATELGKLAGQCWRACLSDDTCAGEVAG